MGCHPVVVVTMHVQYTDMKKVSKKCKPGEADSKQGR